MPGTTNYSALLASFNSQRFTALRSAQAATLDLYSSAHTADKDLAVELPTGAGKSLIALLIGEAWRREGQKTAILTGNKTLARQMETEAAALGINVVRMEGGAGSIPSLDKRRYQRAQAVAVMNYWVYFNQNPPIDPADLLIMDDAHLAEHCLHSLYSAVIDRYEHKALFSALVSELAARFPDYSVIQDALDDNAPPSGVTELLSFIDQDAVLDRIREIVDASPDRENDSDLRFRWKRIRDRIHTCNVYMSNQQLWFRPAIYPLTTNEYYSRPKQRLYMSATIGDTGDLARRLGTNPIRKLPLAPEYAAYTYGRRMVVMNRTEDQDIPQRLGVAILTALKVHPKSVWLLSSRAEAQRYKEAVTEWLNKAGFVGHPTWLLTSQGDEVEQFKQSPQGHLFVAGRFDGMDFKADECRLVVLATLPRAINLQEEFYTAYLRDASFMLNRLNQRIVQGLGRCNRGPHDFGIYILAERRFASHFGRESNRAGLPSNVVAEIDAAEDATEIPIAELQEQITAFLTQDFTAFDERMQQYRAEVPTIPAIHEPLDTSGDEVVGWTELFQRENFQAAKAAFSKCSKRASELQIRDMGAFLEWCEAKAAFLSGRQGDVLARSEAIDLLSEAIERGSNSSWFNRLRSSLNRYRAASGQAVAAAAAEYPEVLIQTFDEYLETLGKGGNRFQKWVEDLKHKLESDKHPEYQEGLEKLGKLLGYFASRPKYSASTDCRWRGIFGNTREAVTFEVKVEHAPTTEIAPKDVGQAHNQLTRAKNQYAQLGYAVRGTIVTHLAGIDSSAASSLGEIRIVPKEAVSKLAAHVLTLLSQYRDNWSLTDVDARISAGEQLLPKIPKAGWLTRALDAPAQKLSVDALLAEWG